MACSPAQIDAFDGTPAVFIHPFSSKDPSSPSLPISLPRRAAAQSAAATALGAPQERRKLHAGRERVGMDLAHLAERRQLR